MSQPNRPRTTRVQVNSISSTTPPYFHISSSLFPNLLRRRSPLIQVNEVSSTTTPEDTGSTRMNERRRLPGFSPNSDDSDE